MCDHFLAFFAQRNKTAKRKIYCNNFVDIFYVMSVSPPTPPSYRKLNTQGHILEKHDLKQAIDIRGPWMDKGLVWLLWVWAPDKGMFSASPAPQEQGSGDSNWGVLRPSHTLMLVQEAFNCRVISPAFAHLPSLNLPPLPCYDAAEKTSSNVAPRFWTSHPPGTLKKFSSLYHQHHTGKNLCFRNYT